MRGSSPVPAGGLAAALPQLLSGEIDVAFGHTDPGGLPATIAQRPVRSEPLGLLVAPDDPLARHQRIPTSRLRGLTIDTSAGNPRATEWTELGADLCAAWGAHPAPPHPHVVGAEETGRHLAEQGMPILTHTTTAPVPDAVLVRLTDPTPGYQWRMLWRRAARHPALDALSEAVDQLVQEPGWPRT